MYHLSALYLNPPDCSVLVTIWYTQDDKSTTDLLRYFNGLKTPNLLWNFQPIKKEYLLRRAIARNITAKETTADWVWFNDVDTFPGKGGISSLIESLDDTDSDMAYPKTVQVTTEEYGDKLISNASGAPRILTTQPESFQPLEYDRAIGGVQIVRREALRKHGYCDEERWQKPVKSWKRTVDDTVFRANLGIHGKPIEVPNIYRILHSKKGREENVEL